MRKSNLFVGALLLCVLTLFTGCKEVMGSLDNPVNSYFELTETTTKIYRGQTYQIKYTTISDAKPVFKSADEKIALVDPNTGVITGANKGKTKITVELPATTNYNAASKEFEVEVDALLSLPATEKEIAKGATYDLGVKCESDGVVTYKSSNTEVATVDNTGKVTAVAYGDATITVSVAATPKFDRSEEATFTAKVRVLEASQLTKAIEDKVELILLAANATITLEKAIKPTVNTVIKGEENKPANISIKKNFEIKTNFTLENVKVDASGNGDKAFIKMATPSFAANAKGYFLLDNIILRNVVITNVKGSLIYDNKVQYCVKDLTIDNCILDFETVVDQPNNSALISFQGGGVKDFTIKNSTVYGNGTPNGKNGTYFLRYSNQVDPARFGLDDADTWSFNYYKNTFYNVTTGNWSNVSRINNVKTRTIFNVENNIWVDCGNGQIAQRMQNQQTGFKTTNFVSNTYWKGSSAIDQTTYTNGEVALKTNPAFKDASNADFTPTGADQVAKQTGDPRWFKK